MSRLLKKYILVFVLFFSIKLVTCQEYSTVKYDADGVSFLMVIIPGKNYAVCNTETTQQLYEKVMGDNPSHFVDERFPVDSVSWYDCIVFCNKLSILLGKNPCYSVDGKTDPDEWDYEIHCASSLNGTVEIIENSDGFRLLTEEEWEYAAAGSDSFNFSGTENPLEDGWFRENSGYTTHTVAGKKANAYGLYDMTGNVWEWVFDAFDKNKHYKIYKGGSWASDSKLCSIAFKGHHYPSRNGPCYSYFAFGFRFACDIFQ